jgi:hypothetical protein
MAYPILGNPKPAFFDSSGSPLASGTITVQNPSDSAAKASYPTADDANANTNSTTSAITLDARGEPTSTQLWGKDGEDYKIIVKDSAGDTVYTIDDIRLPAHTRRALVQFGGGDATPTIAESNIFRCAATTITDFDDGEVGDIIHVWGPSSGETTITNSGSVNTNDGFDAILGAGDSISFIMYSDQSWYEISRSINSDTLFETVNSTNTITEAENGKTFFLNNTTGFVSTLPTPAKGLKFKFIIQTVPTSGNNTIVTSGSSNIMDGTVLDIVGELVYAADRDVITFVASTCVSGDWVEVVSDGSSWFYTAFSGANGGITTGQT